MKDKYYAPTLEEFHLGFEYYFCSAYQEGVSTTEVIIDGKDGYEPYIFNFDIFNYSRPNKGDSWKDVFESWLEYDQVKVKYLDKADIESLGFGDYQPPYEYDHTWTKGQWEIKVWFNQYLEGKQIEPKVRLTHYHQMFFHGAIKNKSELKVLLKQLGIN